jgi:hypothetical protein
VQADARAKPGGGLFCCGQVLVSGDCFFSSSSKNIIVEFTRV